MLCAQYLHLPNPHVITLRASQVGLANTTEDPQQTFLRTERRAANSDPSPSTHMQGIGRATALLYAKKGFNVVVAARDLTKLQYVAYDCAQVS
jgi:hypothetical protein